jgi:nucleoside-diphosphate-sugar epimerase
MTETQAHPEAIRDEAALDELLSRPSEALTTMMARLEGDVMVLGVAGKMGLTLSTMAARAIQAAGSDRRVIGVARFSDPESRAYLAARDVETIRCDLLDRRAVAALPRVKNVIYMVGRKFGTGGQEHLTWATNVIAPDHVGEALHESRIVVFSTGCVYPLVDPAGGGCTEATPPDPVGEYAQSCLGRERIFEYWSRRHDIPICLVRLNYAIDLRYGVLYDIGQRVFAGEPVDLTASHVNVIWQGDANRFALRCLDLCDTPPVPLNVTGPETVPVRYIAETFARHFDVEARFTGGEGRHRMYLSNAAQATARFGYPSVDLLTMIRWQAAWIQQGGRSLNKPTHFEVDDGRY